VVGSTTCSCCPILAYLFVVAIGTDYNTPMIARLREEAREGNEPRAAAELAVEHADPRSPPPGHPRGHLRVAAARRGDLPHPDGVAVTVGIVLAAFVISLALVPAVTALIGHRAWWPGHADESDDLAARDRHRLGDLDQIEGPV